MAFSNEKTWKMTHNHISSEERRIIEALTQVGSTNKEIAEELGLS